MYAKTLQRIKATLPIRLIIKVQQSILTLQSSESYSLSSHEVSRELKRKVPWERSASFLYRCRTMRWGSPWLQRKKLQASAQIQLFFAFSPNCIFPFVNISKSCAVA